MSRDRDLNHLHPFARERHDALVVRAGLYGLTLITFETWRDEAQQLADWRIGRDEHGNIIGRTITNARPGASWHGVTYATGKPASFAWHSGIRRSDGGIVGLGDAKGYGAALDRAGFHVIETVALIALDLGIRPGADWDQDGNLREKGEHDLLHFEVHPNGATLAQVVAVMQQQGDIDRMVRA